MRKISATARIAISLVALSTSLLMMAMTLGFFPDRTSDVSQGRTHLCESMALSFSTMARFTNTQIMEDYFQAVAGRNPDIISIGLRQAEGILLLTVGNHGREWITSDSDESTETQNIVPIYSGNRRWGTIEIKFEPINKSGLAGFFLTPVFTLPAFMAVALFVVYYLYLRRVLRQLNPSKVIPGRVREAFDSLAEGILVLDAKEQVILANRAFEQATGRSSSQLIGCPISDLRFVSRDEEHPNRLHPWEETMAHNRLVTGRLLGCENDTKTFSVSATPILDERGNSRGVLASFEDVTKLENKKEELQQLVVHLNQSSEEIRRQNKDLEQLANHDPLTGCCNRRSFFEQFGTVWKSAQRYGVPLSAIMVDIDHFKSVNDEHGHGFGDEVLKKVAGTLRTLVRDSDVLCRYGGEEFAVVLPHTDIDQAEIAAERFRLGIEELRFPHLSVTASFGVSLLSESTSDPQGLLDQADKCLYVAKRNGRNQVVRWDQASAEIDVEDSPTENTPESQPETDTTSIPYHAVTALVSALSYRDQTTAAHSRRVADLCVAVAEGLLSLRDCYTLEMAALLHDIGKIGVPDAILLKPGRLSPSEWEVMRNNTRIGGEIIHASFGSEALSELVRTCHTRFEDFLDPGTGKSIPVGARILAIANAYDSMTSDRVYRAGKPHKEAVEELRQHAGTQFDPELVERFICIIEVRDKDSSRQNISQPAEVALSIGVQIERLVAALDRQDLDEIRILAGRLEGTALKFGVEDIASKASDLELALQTDGDLFEIMQIAMELLDLCRSTQAALLERPKALRQTLEKSPDFDVASMSS